ncbi:hypothetical protein B7494_g5964 [Chlorociboria aeruginascens]|nr:hypothetical protein B7494_g5964 [Chlorociboria aeruginascens]
MARLFIGVVLVAYSLDDRLAVWLSLFPLLFTDRDPIATTTFLFLQPSCPDPEQQQLAINILFGLAYCCLHSKTCHDLILESRLNNLAYSEIAILSIMISPSGPGLEPGETRDLSEMTRREDFKLSTKRRSSIIAREKLSLQAVHSDDEDDSDVWEVPSPEHRKDGTPPPKRRRHRRSTQADKPRRKTDKGVFVGYYIDYPGQMPVRAVYYPNGSLNCRVLREEVAEDIIAEKPEFFAAKAQVTMPFLILDPVIFGDIASKKLTDEEKKEAIRDYLVKHGIPKPSTTRKSRKEPKGPSEPKKPDKLLSLVKPGDYPFDLRVGCLTDNNERPIWAFLKGNSVCFRVHDLEEENELSFVRGHGGFGGQIRYSMVQLDDEFVRGDKVETEAYIKTLLETADPYRIDTQQPTSDSSISMGDHTRSFTSSNIASGPIAEESLSTPKPTTARDLDMLVGVLKSDPNCEVFAYIISGSLKSTLNFRYHFTAENQHLQNRGPGVRCLVAFDAVNIDPKFLRESSEQTKAFIRTSIMELYPELRFDAQASSPRSSLGDHSRSTPISQIIRDSRSRSGADEPPGRTSQVRGDRITRELHTNKMTPNRDPNPNQQKTTVDTQRYIIKECDTYKKTLSDRDSLISRQKTTIDAQRRTITALQNKVRGFEASQDPNSLSLDESAQAIQKLIIHDKLYRILDKGPNVGKYLQVKPSRIEVNGKSYLEWIALSEIKLHMDSHGEVVPFIHDGMEVYRVPDGEHEGLLVQTIGPNSIFELNDQKFIRWAVRKEVPDEKLNI